MAKYKTKGRVKIKAEEVIVIHAVIPDHGAQYDVHTHGLEGFGHKELQVLCPGFCVVDMANMLNYHADRVLNHGEKFSAGETGERGGYVFGYAEVPGDCGEGPSRLRIVDLPEQCLCSKCKEESTDANL